MVEITTRTSRRARLGWLGTAPIASVAITPASPWASALGALHREWGDEPAILRRTREGRSLSRFRYHNAESFFAGIEEGIVRDRSDVLYQTGIVMQLGISAHLLDVGFDENWCARHIGLRIAKSLAYANATGFDYDHSDTNLLAAILTPYYRWRNPMMLEQGYFAAALETLPLLTRTVFLLNCRDDLPYVEIGWRCGISPDEVIVRMGDALLAIDRTMRSGPSFAGRIRRALLPCRDAWAAARMREGDRRLAPWRSPERRPGRRRGLDWIALAYELVFR